MPIPAVKGNFSEALYIDYNKGEKPSLSSTGIMSATMNPVEKFSVSFGAGYTTNSKNIAGVVFEGKGTYSFNEYTNMQLRIRSSHSEAVDKTQFRLSPGFKYKVADKTTLYANPYVSANIDYRSDKCSLDYGVFAGITQGLGNNIKLSIEGQRYHDHWGTNIIASFNF